MCFSNQAHAQRHQACHSPELQLLEKALSFLIEERCATVVIVGEGCEKEFMEIVDFHKRNGAY